MFFSRYNQVMPDTRYTSYQEYKVSGTRYFREKYQVPRPYLT
jgi:hypothetical protein